MDDTTEKMILVIGAGLAGLSLGCYAQMNGYQSQIFEQHSSPGGLAAAWKRKEYLIDGGIHFVTGYKPGIALYDIFHEVGADKANFIETNVYGIFVDEVSNRSVEITSDLDKLDSDLKALFPKDKNVINEVIAGCRAMAKKDVSDLGFRKPVELMGLWDKIREMWKALGLLKYFTGKFAKPVKQYVEKIQDPMFRELLMYMFLPDVPVWFILMLLSLLSNLQVGMIEDGSLEFAKTIERRYIELGGKITYQANVEEILVEKDHAIGVRLEDGSIFRSNYVVSAADGYHTIYDLLKGRYVNEEIEKRYRIWKMCSPLMVISFGVAQEFEKDPWMTILKLDKPITIANREIDFIFLRIFNYSSKFAPLGKTVIQVVVETDWNYWYDLRKDGHKYNTEKEIVAAKVLKRLEKHYPDISSKVEVTDVATPFTFWRYTRNREGAYMGWLPTPETMFAQIKKTLPGLENFYMAGQWAMSTGGVQPTIYSGRHVIQLICHREGNKFKTIQS
jgi:phytoene dehydrogenase-like protein